MRVSRTNGAELRARRIERDSMTIVDVSRHDIESARIHPAQIGSVQSQRVVFASHSADGAHFWF